MVTGSKGNNNMMLVIEWVVDFVMDFAMDKMRFRVDYTRARGPSVGPFAALFTRCFQYNSVNIRGVG